MFRSELSHNNALSFKRLQAFYRLAVFIQSPRTSSSGVVGGRRANCLSLLSTQDSYNQALIVSTSSPEFRQEQLRVEAKNYSFLLLLRKTNTLSTFIIRRIHLFPWPSFNGHMKRPRQKHDQIRLFVLIVLS